MKIGLLTNKFIDDSILPTGRIKVFSNGMRLEILEYSARRLVYFFFFLLFFFFFNYVILPYTMLRKVCLTLHDIIYFHNTLYSPHP